MSYEQSCKGGLGRISQAYSWSFRTQGRYRSMKGICKERYRVACISHV